MIKDGSIHIIKLGAIDIGSNSIRLLITNVIPSGGHTYYQKVSMIRLPIRLGSDVFTKNKISKKNAKRMLNGIKAYKLLMDVHGVEDYRACATSAMRESENGHSLAKKILEETGINIEIIDGKEEAHLIYESKLFDKIQPTEDTFIFVDVGGGSTELTLFKNGELVSSKSFKIGSVRLLKDIVDHRVWEEMGEWIDHHKKGIDNLAMIGSGGNINKLFKLSEKPLGEPLTLDYMLTQRDALAALSREEKVTRLALNLDRADVIVPALGIYIFATQKAGATNMYVPKIGVSDGITRDLYHRKYRALMEQIKPHDLTS